MECAMMTCRQSSRKTCCTLSFLITAYAACAAVEGSSTPGPRTRFMKHRPSVTDIESFLDTITASTAINHRMQGRTLHLEPRQSLLTSESLYSSPDPELKGWRIVYMKVRLGEGRGVYRKAVEALRRWDMHAGSTDTGIHRTKHAVATMAQVYGGLGFVLNPCRVSYQEFDQESRGQGVTWSAVAYATAGNHLIQGEERMRVLRNAQGDVWFDLCSIARGNGVLGRLAFPFNRGMQSHFFKEQLRAMERQASGR